MQQARTERLKNGGVRITPRPLKRRKRPRPKLPASIVYGSDTGNRIARKHMPIPKPRVDLLRACRDPKLFKRWFPGDTWDAWFSFLAAIFGLPMNNKQKQIYYTHTKRQKLPTRRVKEAWLVIGRRGGKSRALALIAVYLACFHDWRRYLSPGERGTIMIIASDRSQARSIFNYIHAFLHEIPMLKALILKDPAEQIQLKRQVNIEIHTASFRTVRGYTLVAALLDEIAFFRSDDSANPDKEVLKALRPGMKTMPGAMLLCSSSPYARSGVLWEIYNKWYAKDNKNILVWKGKTTEMNPSLTYEDLEDDFEEDPAAAEAEYNAEFRKDIAGYVPRRMLDLCTMDGTEIMRPLSEIVYNAFVDPSGGSSDSFTLAIAHEQDGIPTLDGVWAWDPPFSPAAVARQISKVVKEYNCTSVTGDRYAGRWPADEFEENGITYVVSDMTKSELYLELLPKLNSGQCELVDNERMCLQFEKLERRTARGKKDIIDHPPKGKDDLANAAAGALVGIANTDPADTW